MDTKKMERLLEQWLLQRNDISGMQSIYEFPKKKRKNISDNI